MSSAFFVKSGWKSREQKIIYLRLSVIGELWYDISRTKFAGSGVDFIAIVGFAGDYPHFKNGNVVTEVLKGINLTVYEQEFVSIMGPSGSGKSTLLNIVGCLDRPSAGLMLWPEPGWKSFLTEAGGY
jgi:ABC-type multidrug transport system fused ATPase/permease subunit